MAKKDFVKDSELEAIFKPFTPEKSPSEKENERMAIELEESMRNEVFNGKVAVQIKDKQLDALDMALFRIDTNPSFKNNQFEYINTLQLNDPEISDFAKLNKALQSGIINKIELNFTSENMKNDFINKFSSSAMPGVKSIALSAHQVNQEDINKVAAGLLQNTNIAKTIKLNDTAGSKLNSKDLVALLDNHPKLNIKADGVLGMQLRFATAKRSLQNFFNKLSGKDKLSVFDRGNGANEFQKIPTPVEKAEDTSKKNSAEQQVFQRPKAATMPGREKPDVEQSNPDNNRSTSFRR